MRKLKAILLFIYPGPYRLLSFLMIGLMLSFLYEQNTVEVVSDRKTTRPKCVTEYHYGKPFTAYVKRKDNKQGKWDYEALTYNLIIAYALTLFFFGMLLSFHHIFRKGHSFKRRGIAFVTFVGLVTFPYLFLFFASGSLMINAVERRVVWQVSALTYIGMSPNRLSFDGQDFPLKEAAFNLDIRMVKYLIKHGANVNMANTSGETALHIAVRENALEVIKELIRRGAKVNKRDKYGKAALHYANHLKVVKLLIANGADVNLRDVKKRTPLFLLDSAESRKYLIQRGARASVVDYAGNTILHYLQNAEDIPMLVRAGVKINHRNFKGKTALHMLVPEDNVTPSPTSIDIAKALIKSGADVDAVDNSGKSPLHYMILNCNTHSKLTTSIELGKVFYKSSVNVRTQLRKKKIVGKLNEVIQEDKKQCWTKISGRSGSKLVKRD